MPKFRQQELAGPQLASNKLAESGPWQCQHEKWDLALMNDDSCGLDGARLPNVLGIIIIQYWNPPKATLLAKFQPRVKVQRC